MKKEFKNLFELADAVGDRDPRVMTEDGKFRKDLPTFGGSPPDDMENVLSWDNEMILLGDDKRDKVKIIGRNLIFI
jgi:hypothetical protein